MSKEHPNKTHGGSYKPEYVIWKHMRYRCNDPTDRRWKNYGGRGIRVCEEWQNDFGAFFAYIGPRPTPQHSIDRYPNNDGNYEPGNVRWATRSQQMLNRRPRKKKVPAPD